MNKLLAKANTICLAGVVYAQGAGPININPGGQWNPLGNLTPASIVSGFIRFVLMIGALIFFFMLLWGGIKWIMSQGDKGNVETARNQITNALVGLAIIFVAWAIIKLIETLFGISILSLDIPSLQ